ncbi:hypothetical protein PAHAL_9G134200 [Panicum hallii]|uniref:Uncharacterized protein n=1 Tax=Panicum hallii TaxID=206008 RepID=A0A2T8I1A0_9POAL|nr:hypothetical protein PAHAL_9G134200 [Panicum hallii]
MHGELRQWRTLDVFVETPRLLGLRRGCLPRSRIAASATCGSCSMKCCTSR